MASQVVREGLGWVPIRQGGERKVDPNYGPFFEVTMPNEEYKITVYEKEPGKMLR